MFFISPLAIPLPGRTIPRTFITTLSPERLEISELKKNEKGEMVHVMLTPDEIKLLIETCQKEQEAESKSSGDI